MIDLEHAGRGAVAGGAAAALGLGASAVAIYVLHSTLQVVEPPSPWFYLLQFVGGGAVFGIVLGTAVENRSVAVAGPVAGGCLLAAVLAFRALAASYLLVPLVPLGYGLATVGTLLVLTRPVPSGQRIALASWTLSGWCLSVVVALVVAAAAPDAVGALAPTIVHADQVAEMAASPRSLIALVVGYPFFAALTFPLAGAAYGAGLCAVGGGAPDAGAPDGG